MTADENFARLLRHIEEEINALDLPEQPALLYDPIRYILSLGGKRLRPALVLLGAQISGGDYRKAMPQALAVEVFHNFTLLHDDIMDSAAVRRGKASVHTKWGSNVAILSGDTMLVKAYQLLTEADPMILPALLKTFSKTATEVCEGQQLDMDYSDAANISITQYTEMIRLKTAVLLGCSLEIGARVSGATDARVEALRKLGEIMGLAFQLQDDLLDAFGDASIGKKVGGDIIEGKRTWLFLTCLQRATEEDQQKLADAMNSPDREERLSQVMDLYRKYEVEQLCSAEVATYVRKAEEALTQIQGNVEALDTLRMLITSLSSRQH